ncbi:methionine--tRNA ligase [Patescibacteria group bacterium]|nr:methionine--tRNA ligase [Patescibacteria group bacterium]
MNKQAITMNKFYVTTPIYYVNAKPHLGHAYTTIAADVVARFQRMNGQDVFFLTGTDEHGSKVASKAKEEGKEAQAFCDEYSAHYEMLFDRLNISNNDFLRTTQKRHQEGVEVFMNKLHEDDNFYEDSYKGLYCTGCEKFMTEKDLVDGKCPDHKKTPEKLAEKNYFFKLKKYLPQVKDLIARGEIEIAPEGIRKEVLGLLDHEVLDDFSVSRESVKWGIPLPFDDSQVIYVWVEALQNYITALGYGQEDDDKLKKFWPADVHLMAKEIIKFHAIFWPAMLLAAGLEVPKKIFAHGFFTINGDKMSKTLGNVIDPNDLIDDFGTDATRYLLLSQFPFGQDGDIKVDKFLEQYNSDLAGGISNLLHRTLSMTESYFNSQVPRRPSKSIIEESLFEKTWKNFRKSLEEIRIDDGLGVINQLVQKGNQLVDERKPWEQAKQDQEALADTIYTLLELNRHIAFMVYPFMPEIAEKMQQALGVAYDEHVVLDDLSKWGSLEPGTKTNKGKPLFMRK